MAAESGFEPPVKNISGGPAKKLYAWTWTWSQRVILYNRQVTKLPRKTKTYATYTGPWPSNLNRSQTPPPLHPPVVVSTGSANHWTATQVNSRLSEASPKTRSRYPVTALPISAITTKSFT
jgi:hypothetical protein